MNAEVSFAILPSCTRTAASRDESRMRIATRLAAIMNGRGGYYGSLHPAYQPFNVSSEFSSPSTRHSIAATVSDTSHR